MAEIVAIVGRPNVGKSTLYNRLIGERQAIIDNVSGVTRDRIYGFSDWNGREFTVVDTGGFVHGSDDVFEAAIRRQVHIAMDEADVIIFLTDVTTGITDLDAEIADMLRKTDKNVILAVNKVDNGTRALAANEFWSLGFENTLFLSSMTGSGSGEVLDMVTELLPKESTHENNDGDLHRIAIIGQPNVGKSSLTNALLGEERNIVTDVAGTTRDSIDTKYSKFGKEFILIDTAGIRKKAKVHEDLEFYSVIRAVKAIDEADVCILMFDARDGLTSQDMAIVQLVLRRKKGLVVLSNKWDLVGKETNTAKEYEEAIKHKLAPFNDVPVIFTSVTEKQRIFKAIEITLEVAENRKQKIKTSELNQFLEEILKTYPPPAHKGKFIKIKYVTQLPLYYPAFAFFCNSPKYVKESYRNYIENAFRKKYNLTGVPISIFFREK
jgi:GTP-binding protein